MLVETFHFVAENPEMTVAALVAFGMAFSYPVRKKILARDGADVWDGSTEHLEAAHIDHSKSNPNYNTESNGRMLKAHNHYMDHYNRAGRNGLNGVANDWALRAIWARLSEEEKVGLPSPPEKQDW